jgi:hypothetical protein
MIIPLPTAPSRCLFEALHQETEYQFHPTGVMKACLIKNVSQFPLRVKRFASLCNSYEIFWRTSVTRTANSLNINFSIMVARQQFSSYRRFTLDP